jgi:uncharacterized protein YerC
MAKILPYSIPPKTKKELLKEFYDFICSLDRKETEDFFRDFLTSSEKIILARRLRVAKMLLQGYSSTNIRKKLGVGVSTVQFVTNWVKDELEERRVKQKLPLIK